MYNTSISRRALLRGSAFVGLVALNPLPLAACRAAAIPDGYAAWIRHRGQQGWTVTCASRYQVGSFLPFSVTKVPLSAAASDYGSAPIGVAREAILADLAEKAGLLSSSLAFENGLIRGAGLRVPASVWVDYTSV